ncbi:MAG: HAD family phosphatase [Defluviitaleaceae bacterium]|nr:HAD family phosphatase [Defluviitaleaceae bacterium]MCL2261714.1 HAD family phosphatase [Defluviitaleaceae bacterium]
MKTLPKLVIFDMDGTMLDTEPVSLAGMIHAGKILGVEIKKEIGESLMGKSLKLGTEILRANYGETFDINQAYKLHREYMDDFFEKNGISTKAGIFELLDTLEKLQIKKCVATSTGKARATHKLTQTNLAHRFQTITGGDEVENGKPSPDIFLKAAESCGVAPQDCIILEDTEAGILGAVAANIPVIAIPDIAPLTQEIRAKAFAVCTDLHEVATILEDLGGLCPPNPLQTF